MKQKKRKPVGWNDSGNPEVERRELDWATISSGMGRTQVETDCPFCGDGVIAYLWSLCGSGKRCENEECRALLGSRSALQWKEKIKDTKTD